MGRSRDVLSLVDSAAAEPGAAWVEVARAVALAHVLPGVKVRGGAGASRLAAWLARAQQDPAGVEIRELAGILVDAETVSRVVGSGAAGWVQRRAVRRLSAVMASLPEGLVPAGVARQALAAVGVAARLECLAEALSGPDHAAAVDRWTARLERPGVVGQPGRLAEWLSDAVVAEAPAAARVSAAEFAAGPARERRGGVVGWPERLLPAELVADARSAATARAAAAALAERARDVAAAAEVLAGQLRVRAAPAGPDTTARVRRRLAVAEAPRRDRAVELTEKLLAAARAAGPEPPVPAPKAPVPDPGLLRWLRSRVHRGLYTRRFEEWVGRWLGGDPFGLRQLPPRPAFLADVPVTELPAEWVAPFLRRISLDRPAPTAAELSAGALAGDTGPVSVALRGRRLRRWGQPKGWAAPLLPRRTRVPHVVHGIWLGRAMPARSVFWRNYAAAARRYAGRVDFVVWTDIPRDRFAAVLAAPEPPADEADAHAEVRRLLRWARDNGIHLVNVSEVFHAAAPMRLHAQYVLEMAKQLPRGYASASDHLRVEIIHRFGGLYADGDMTFVPSGRASVPETLPAFFDRLAASVPGFTLNPQWDGRVGADLFAAPARHPALSLWLELARLNYCRTQPHLFGGLHVMAAPYVGRPWQEHRYLAPHRTGGVHYDLLEALGMRHAMLPPTKPAVLDGRELSWLPPAGGEPVAAARRHDREDAVVGTLARCLTFLRWQLVTRGGNLYLSAVDPVIRGLPDPEAAWTALLNVLPVISAGLPQVSSVTDLRRNDDGRLEAVHLPPEAEALLHRHPPRTRWLGDALSRDGRPVWLLDERVAQATLRAAGTPARPSVDALIPLAELAVNVVGHPIGVWLRARYDADRWQHLPRFTDLPGDHFGIHLGGPHADAVHDLNLHPEAVAALLLHLGAAARPIRLTVPGGALDAARPLAVGLRDLLDQPVHLTETRTRLDTQHQPAHPRLPAVHHIPLAGHHHSTSAPHRRPSAAVAG